MSNAKVRARRRRRKRQAQQRYPFAEELWDFQETQRYAERVAEQTEMLRRNRQGTARSLLMLAALAGLGWRL